MKREATTHTKMVRLERRLDLRHYEAVGLLELLWHLTAKEAPAGNIGKLPDEDIAASIGWEFNPETLVEALVYAGWLDKHDVYRLIIHDWREHCEDSVHTKLARARCTFADGSLPVFSKFSKKQQEIYEKSAAAGEFKPPRAARMQHTCSIDAACVPQYQALPNQTKPNQTKPFLAAKNGDETPPGMPDPFDEFKRTFKGEFPDDTWRAFMTHVNTPERLTQFQANTPLWLRTVKYRDGYGKDAKWFIKSGVWKLPPDPSLLPHARDSPDEKPPSGLVL